MDALLREKKKKLFVLYKKIIYKRLWFYKILDETLQLKLTPLLFINLNESLNIFIPDFNFVTLISYNNINIEIFNKYCFNLETTYNFNNSHII